MTALLCTRCSDEGHLIRVAPGRLAPLHLTRHDHPFRLGRLAPAARNAVPAATGLPEGPDSVGDRAETRAFASDLNRTSASAGARSGIDPSSRTPNRTRPAGNGRTRTVSPPGSFR